MTIGRGGGDGSVAAGVLKGVPDRLNERSGDIRASTFGLRRTGVGDGGDSKIERPSVMDLLFDGVRGALGGVSMVGALMDAPAIGA